IECLRLRLSHPLTPKSSFDHGTSRRIPTLHNDSGPPMEARMTTNRPLACRALGICMMIVAVLPAVTFAGAPSVKVESLLLDYDDLAVKANALIEAYREARKTGTTMDRDKGLVMRRAVG